MNQRGILYVEENENDVVLLRRALERVGGRHPLSVARDGQEALDYLSGKGKFRDRKRHPLPVVVILDWELPGMTGFEVLKWVRKHTKLAGVKVVVFTYSNWEEDFRRAREAGADGFFCKPYDFKGTEEFARAMMLLLAKAGGGSRVAAGGIATNDETLRRLAGLGRAVNGRGGLVNQKGVVS